MTEINELIKGKEPTNTTALSFENLSIAYQNLDYTDANGYFIKSLNDNIEGKATLKDFISYLKSKLNNDNNYKYIIISELCKSDSDCHYYALKVGDDNA